MLQSMTGYGSTSLQIDELEIHVEIKTLNTEKIKENAENGFHLALVWFEFQRSKLCLCSTNRLTV